MRPIRFAILPLGCVALVALFGGACRDAVFCAATPLQKEPPAVFPSILPEANNKFGLYIPPLPPLLPKPAHLPPLIASGKLKSYRIVALPKKFQANALNDKGEIAGTWFGGGARPTFGEPATYKRASVWKNNSMTHYPNRKEQPDCEANAISENSEVGCSGGATYSDPLHGRYSAFIWSLAAQNVLDPSAPAATLYKTQDIGHLPNQSNVVVRGINSHRQLVGWCSPWDMGEEGFGGASGEFEDVAGDFLPEATGFYWDGHRLIRLQGAAYGINERNQVVGVQNGNITLWQHDERLFLGEGRAYCINNSGWIAGEKTMPSKNIMFYNVAPIRHAFVWRGSGALEDLKCLPGDTNSKARWINDRGQIVGLSLRVLGETKTQTRAVLWQAGKIIDLNTFMPRSSRWILIDARAVNNKGQIIVRGKNGYDERSFLLTPR